MELAEVQALECCRWHCSLRWLRNRLSCQPITRQKGRGIFTHWYLAYEFNEWDSAVIKIFSKENIKIEMTLYMHALYMYSFI